EWFSSDSQPVAVVPGSSSYDDFDEIPKKNRGPMIIAGVTGGLILVGVIVIALLPKPEHKPLRGEVAANATGEAATPSGAAAQPSGAAAQPSGAAVQPSGAATAPTGGAATPTGAAMAPSGVATAPSGAAPGVTSSGAPAQAAAPK